MATYFSILSWKNPMDRGAWQTTVHGVAESDMTEQLNSSSSKGSTDYLFYSLDYRVIYHLLALRL